MAETVFELLTWRTRPWLPQAVASAVVIPTEPHRDSGGASCPRPIGHGRSAAWHRLTDVSLEAPMVRCQNATRPRLELAAVPRQLQRLVRRRASGALLLRLDIAKTPIAPRADRQARNAGR